MAATFEADPESKMWVDDALSSGDAKMGKKLYVGNLSFKTTDGDLEQLFSQYGSVQSALVVQDKATGRSRGFGFVEMGSDQEAQAAIAALNGKESDGRALTVNEAKPRPESRGGGGGGGGGGRGDRDRGSRGPRY
jgi:cold-inducible RNA-binding protein